MIETVPLAKAAEAYGRMMRNEARFRISLWALATINKHHADGTRTKPHRAYEIPASCLISLVTLNPTPSLAAEYGVVSQLIVMIRIENNEHAAISACSPSLATRPQPGRFPVEGLPLGNSDYLLPRIPSPGFYRRFKAGHPPLQIG